MCWRDIIWILLAKCRIDDDDDDDDVYCRSDIDVYSEAGCKKAENLFKELMMMIEAMQDSLRAQASYVLEQTLDFSTAFSQFKVKLTQSHFKHWQISCIDSANYSLYYVSILIGHNMSLTHASVCFERVLTQKQKGTKISGWYNITKGSSWRSHFQLKQ